MRNLFVLLLIAGTFIFASCGQNAKEKAATDQAKIDSIVQSETAAAKQEVMDSLAKVEEEMALQAKMDSLESEVQAAKNQAKKAAASAKKVEEAVKEEPKEATPTRSGASKRRGN